MANRNIEKVKKTKFRRPDKSDNAKEKSRKDKFRVQRESKTYQYED